MGGEFFKILFVSAALAAMFASSLSSHASVSRMIYVMARNGTGRIPRFLSYIHPKFLTPLHAVLIVGAVSLLAFKFTLEFVSSMINFGALIAFTVVNLTVLLYYAVRLKKRNTPVEIITNIVLPIIGMCLTAVLWINLHFDALLYGAIWFVVGLVLLVYVTRGLRTPLTMKIEEETLADEGTPIPHVEHRKRGESTVKLVVGYLATSGGADAVALGVQLARTLAADLELRMVLAPDEVTTPRVTSGKFHDVLAEQSSAWLDEALRLVPDDVTARGAVLVDDSVAGALSAEALRLEAEAIVVGGSGGGLVGSLSLGSDVDDLLHFAPVPVAVAPRGTRHSTVKRIRSVTCAIGDRPGAARLLETAVRASAATAAPLRLVSLVALDKHGEQGVEAAREHAHATLESVRGGASGGCPRHRRRRRRRHDRGRRRMARLGGRRSPDAGFQPTRPTPPHLHRFHGRQNPAGPARADGGDPRRGGVGLMASRNQGCRS